MTAIAQRSFAGGELSPSFYPRTDSQRYQFGLRTCRNARVMRDGGVQNRAGFEYVVDGSDAYTRLVKYDNPTTGSRPIILVIEDAKVRFIIDGYAFNGVADYVRETGVAIVSITKASPGVVTATAHGYSNGDLVKIIGGQMTELNGQYFRVENKTANTFTLAMLNITNSSGPAIDTTSYTTYSSGGTVERVLTKVGPWGSGEIDDLKFYQHDSGMVIVHPNFDPRLLSCTDINTWTIGTISFAPTIAVPGSVVNTGAAGSATQWKVTAVDAETYEESTPSTLTGSSATPSSGAPITVSWAAVAGAGVYNVYKLVNGIYGFIGTAGGLAFIDNGITADPTNPAPPATPRTPVTGSGLRPNAVGFYQQRLAFGGSTTYEQNNYLSKTGLPNNMNITIPQQDDDAISFKIIKRGKVKFYADISKMVIFTSAGTWVPEGDAAGIITPTDINLRQVGYVGIGDLPPIVIGQNALFVEARNRILRSLVFNTVDGYKGGDLTIFSSHLFKFETIDDIAYQETPHPTVWCVRSDGTLLGMTFDEAQGVIAWHRHDTDGLFKKVCTAPEGDHDSLYATVRRTDSAGYSHQRIERMTVRDQEDVSDLVIMDSAAYTDGTINGGTVTLTSSNGWTFQDKVTMTSDAPRFGTSTVGKEIHVWNDAETEVIRFTVTEYTSSTVVKGYPSKTVPAAMRSVALSIWGIAVFTYSGLYHLAGQEVSVFADGFVDSSPNNASVQTLTVSSAGVLTLTTARVKIRVGLPYISDIETLDIDTSQSVSIASKKKMVSKVTCAFESMRGLFVGPKPPSDDDTDPLEDLMEFKIRDEEGYDEAVDLLTGDADVNLMTEWNSNGRIFMRQVDPVPFTLLAVIPDVMAPFPSRGAA